MSTGLWLWLGIIIPNFTFGMSTGWKLDDGRLMPMWMWMRDTWWVMMGFVLSCVLSKVFWFWLYAPTSDEALFARFLSFQTTLFAFMSGVVAWAVIKRIPAWLRKADEWLYCRFP